MSENENANDEADFMALAGTNVSSHEAPLCENEYGFNIAPEKTSSEKNEPGQPCQYSRYGAGFKSTTSTIKTLPPGCYDIEADNNGVFVVPALKPSGLLLELPEMRSEAVIKAVENFWDSEKDYKEGNEFVHGGAQYKAGIMIYGPPGCHAKGQGILMYDGTIKKVEDIKVGELLMGPDSNPREVLQLCRNRQKMVNIIPAKGDSFEVNLDHILSLMPSGKNMTIVTPINMSVRDLLKQSKVFRERMKLYRVGVEFQKRSEKLEIPPYLLGVWLGDGNSDCPQITSMDTEVSDEWSAWGKSIGLKTSVYKTPSRASTFRLTNGTHDHEGKNAALQILRDLNLIQNKHVPEKYLLSSRQDRLELLAGILDTDGHNTSGCFDFVQKNKVISDQVVFLARSLGLAAYISKTQKGCTHRGVWREGSYYRVSISGNCAEIPVRIPRKRVPARQQSKNVTRTGFKVEHLPENDYYGFSLSGDHLYLLDDFTVTHNTGKSCTIKIVSNKLVERGGTVFFASCHPGTVMSWLSDFARVERNRKCIVILEDIDSMIQNWGESRYLEMLDSAKTIDNVLFIATTNYPERLDPRIYNRPGRFSHVIRIGLPGAAARTAFLKAILKDHRDVETIVNATKDFTIDHLSALVNAVYREKKELLPEIERLRTLFRVPKSDEKSIGMGFGGRKNED